MQFQDDLEGGKVHRCTASVSGAFTEVCTAETDVKAARTWDTES